LTYRARIELLRETKLRQTREKQQIMGAMNYDDHALILPPPERRAAVRTIGSSGIPVTDVPLNGFSIRSNHPSGGFFGPKACGENFRLVLENHPVYIDPVSSLAGGYMTTFFSYRDPHWNPDFDFSHLQPGIDRYQLLPGIGAAQHFCQDMRIGLEFGWGGLLDKIRYYRKLNLDGGRSTTGGPDTQRIAEKADFYDGLESVVLGMQNWIQRTADTAREMAASESNPPLRANLLELAEINARLVEEPPRTFRDACQWMLWHLISARMYNGSGSLGQIDARLYPYYRREQAAGTLTDEDAIFHLACLLLRDTAYMQLGGPGPDGQDQTNPVSYLVLEAAHRLRIPANVGVCVGDTVDAGLLRRGVEIMFEDKTGIPKFLGIDSTTRGFIRNGYPAELARTRVYSGCNWSAIPGREYTRNDTVKINLAAVFEVALREMMADSNGDPNVADLWRRFEYHLRQAVATTAQCLDFHMAHAHRVFPELVLDLLCYGPIEKGEDASHGGVEFYNLCVDGAGLATVADSFAALEQRIEWEKRLTWQQLMVYLANDWAGPDGEHARLMMQNSPRYGQGGTRADDYARRAAQSFTDAVTANPTPAGFRMIPGIFSWASTIGMGKTLGATPNGRHAGAPISHGANPHPGFRADGAATAMAVAIASVQPGFGNTAPMQFEFDPLVTQDAEAVDNICNLIRTHFELGGTQINLNIMDAQKVLEAHADPSKYPDLIVRVTGFSAYFASLSQEFRQLVVDRIVSS
jgi:formate C-acetyltransferase